MMREGSLSQPFQLNSLNLPTPPHTHTPSFMISVLTDNPNRASAEVKNAVNKAGRGKAKMAESGSVSYLYERKGRIVLGKGEVDEEKVLDVCLEVGVEDFEFSEGEDDGSGEEADVVYTSQGDLALLRDGILEGQGVEARSAELCYKSKAPVVVGEEDFELNMDLVDALEELEDVDKVEHNMDN
jgi:transcriptional/translational regulatory protein YebC/TACO1